MASSQFDRTLLAPRHWLTWFGFGVWFLIAQLPYSWQMATARALTPLLRLNKKRVKMARTNLQLCFPQKTEQEIESLLAANLQSTAMAIFETGIGYFWYGCTLYQWGRHRQSGRGARVKLE